MQSPTSGSAYPPRLNMAGRRGTPAIPRPVFSRGNQHPRPPLPVDHSPLLFSMPPGARPCKEHLLPSTSQPPGPFAPKWHMPNDNGPLPASSNTPGYPHPAAICHSAGPLVSPDNTSKNGPPGSPPVSPGKDTYTSSTRIHIVPHTSFLKRDALRSEMAYAWY